MSNVLINVISEFDQKGFKQADSGIAALTKKIAKFTASLGLAHKVQQSVLNAMADEKATKLLAQNLKNVGLAYAQIPAENFIKQMQRQTGILDDELRPAYAQLARVTGSVIKTQELLNTAFNVSAGTGQEFSQVVDALSKAYVGNNKGLRSLNIGLTQAELSSKSFDEILTLLNKQFAGAGATSLDTYAGKMSLLQVATANASETIGFALLDALQNASGANGFEDFINKINNTADAIARLIQIGGRGVEFLTMFGKTLFDKNTPEKFAAFQARIRKEESERGLRKILSGLGTSIGPRIQTAAEKAAELAAKKRAQQILAMQKKITDEKKKQLALEKATTTANALLGQANALFDIERIGVAAAMANQTLTDNERKRLEIKQATFALEDALDSKDTKRIENATKLLAGLMGQFAALQAQDTLLGQIKSALDALGVNKDLINLTNLELAYELLLKMQGLLQTSTLIAKPFVNPLKGTTPPPGVDPKDWNKLINNLDNAASEDVVNFDTPSLTLNNAGFPMSEWDRLNALSANIAPGQIGITFKVTDNAKNLVDIIMETVTEQSASGNPPIVERIGSNLAW